MGKRRRRPSSAKPPVKAAIHPVDAWLITRRRYVALAVLIAAVALRVVYLLQLSSTPLSVLHQWPQTDMHYYNDWAADIAAGDWWSRGVEIPMHRWQHEVARTYRVAYAVGSLPPPGSPEDERADRALWATWMHVPQFYQDPLYAYVLAAIYRLGGQTPRPMFIIQLAAGVGTILLIWSIAIRAFDDVVAAVAVALALLCGPLLFYELLLLRDSLLVALSLLVTWLLLVRKPQEHWWRSALVGIAFGVGFLLKSTFIVFAVAAGAVLASERRWRHVTAMVAAFMIVLSPLIVRNRAVGSPAFALASSGPLTFLSANDANYPPDSGFGVQVPLLVHFLGDTQGTWRDAVRLTAASQSVHSYAAQLWDKWTRTWQWYEIPNNENFYYAQRLVPVLRWLAVTFWAISPLALVGIVLAGRGWRRRAPLFLLLVVSVAPLLAFYVLGRFRLLVIAVAIPFAAFTIVEVCRFVSRRRFGAAIVTALAVVLVATWTGQALGPDQALIRTSDWIVPFSVLYETRIESAASARDWTTAAHLYSDYFDRYQPSLGGLSPADRRALASLLSSMHGDCAELFALAGDRSDADTQRAAASRFATDARR